MARKHIFIGCGGAGSKTVALIKMKVYESLQNVSGNRSKVDVMNDNYRFMFIDTDAGDIDNLNEKYRTKYENGRVKMLSTNELINLGTQNPYVIYQKAKAAQEIQINKRIIEACDDDVAMHMDNRALKFGAGAFRLKSRTAFARLADQFCEKLVKNIQDLNKIEDNAADNNTVCYWVVCSSLGGTGSGIINDVLYFVNMMHKATIDEADPKVILTMYMPQWYIDHNGRNEKYPRNAFAVMSELEAEMAWSKKPETATLFHRLALNDRYSRINTSLPYRPFEALIPVDFQTEAGNNLGNLDSMYSNTAELLCYLHDGPGARGFESFMDNTRDGEVAPGTEKNFLLPMGYVALKKPSADFDDYMKCRIQADLLEHCILGKSVNDKANKVDLNKVVEDLIKDTINAYVLNPDGDNNYFSEIRSQMTQAIKTNFSESRAGVIEGDKRVDKFDAGKMNSAVKKTTQSLADVIDDQDNEALQKSTQEALEQKIWSCVEEMVTAIGLQNTIAAVERLDEECTSLFNHYDKDKDMIQDSIIADFASHLQTKSELNRQNTKYEKSSSSKEKSDLDSAREKAEERTFLEMVHINNNADDIANVYSVYKRGLELKREILIENKIFELIKSFCYGENGFLDVVARHLRALSEAAKTALLSEKGPKQSFKNLAETFRSKKEDITSVYLPNICEFANGDGWKRDNLFAEYYEKLITPDKEAVSGNVRVPTTEALTDFFHTMKNQIEADLKSANYIVESLDENGEATLKSKFFINTERSAEKTIDDIMNFAYKAFGLMCRRNSAVNGWYDKKLPDLINELTTDQLDEVTKRLSPTLFFSYNIGQMDGVLEQRDFCVADNRDNAKKVFNFQESSSQKFIGHSNSELFYIITAKTGMNFEYYRTYHNIKSEYDKCDKKEYYHFHQAFARTGGDVDEIKSLLPIGASNATIAMLKLMILGNYDESTMKKFIVIPDKSYLEGVYGQTPFEVKSNSVVWATDLSLEIQGDKKIQINIAEKGRKYTPCYCNLFYTELSNEFGKRYLSDHYDNFIERYMQAVNALDNNILVQGFNQAKQKVETLLDAKYRDARAAQSFQEMETLKEMLRVLNDKFKTFEDFTCKD